MGLSSSLEGVILSISGGDAYLRPDCAKNNLITIVTFGLEYVVFARLYKLNSCRHQFVTSELSTDLLRRGLLNDRGSYITADLFWSSDAVHVLRGDGLSLRLVLVISNTVN